MALTLYRRHLAACIVRKSKISARAKRLAMDCDCPIWMYGRTGNSLIPRQSTGFTKLAEAEALRASQLARSKGEEAHGVRIDECVQKYLASHKHKPGEKTYGQYELHLGRLQDYCGRRGVFFMGELTVDLLETSKVDGLPDLADTSKSTVRIEEPCLERNTLRRIEHFHRAFARLGAARVGDCPLLRNNIDCEARESNAHRQGEPHRLIFTESFAQL